MGYHPARDGDLWTVRNEDEERVLLVPLQDSLAASVIADVLNAHDIGKRCSCEQQVLKMRRKDHT